MSNPKRTRSRLLVRALLVVVLVPLAALAGMYFAAPLRLEPAIVELNRRLSGLEEKTVEVEGHRVHYLEGGSGETVLLLHGIFAEKDHWTEFARTLTPHYRVIALDLPGFGESTRLEDEPYNYPVQVGRLHAFAQALKLERFHLAGSSMGGALAGFYAVHHPGQVRSLALVGAPHGVLAPKQSESERLIAAGQRPLVAATPEQFERMMGLVFAERPFIPRPILARARENALARARSNERIWREHRDAFNALQPVLPSIGVPVLALWGEQDRIFDVSGAPVLRAGLRDGEVVVLPGVGHLPMLERPRETAGAYLAFLRKHPGAKTPGR